jgi:hypothetical protein
LKNEQTSPGQSPSFSEQIKLFKQKFFEGKAEPRDYLDLLESCPTDLRQHLAMRPEGELFKPEFYNHVIRILRIAAGIYEPGGSLGRGVGAAIIRVVLKKVFSMDLRSFVRLPFAWYNIKNHVCGKMPLSERSLEIHDRHFFRSLGVSRSTDDCSPVLVERVEIASTSKSDTFLSDWKKAQKDPMYIRPEALLTDIQVPGLDRCLLLFWNRLGENWVPSVGLRDFTYSAIGQFCSAILDPKGLRTDDPFERERIRSVVRQLELEKNKSESVTGFYRHNGKYYLEIASERFLLTKP